MQKEMQQHHDMETHIPVNPSKLTHDEKREAVESLCNIVNKHCGQVKARQCCCENIILTHSAGHPLKPLLARCSVDNYCLNRNDV